MKEVTRTLRRPDGAQVAYGIARDGTVRPSLVLVHGMGSNRTRWSEFFESTSLAASWDLLRLDLRGHGDSPWRGPIGMEIWSDDLAAILDAEGYERAIVGGHCLGANFALNFAYLKPGRTQGVVLIEPMPPAAGSKSMRRLQLAAPLLALAVRAGRAANAIGLHRRRLGRLDLKTLDETTRAAMESRQSTHPMSHLYASPLFDLRFMPTAAYLQDLLELLRPLPPLAAIPQPVLALISSGGRFGEPDEVERILAALPLLTVSRLPALHWIPTEQPGPMREAIERWCERIRPDP